MKHDSQASAGRFDRFDPFNGIHMTARDRDAARDAMQNADWIVGLLVQTVSDIQSLATAVTRLWARRPGRAAHMVAKGASL